MKILNIFPSIDTIDASYDLTGRLVALLLIACNFSEYKSSDPFSSLDYDTLYDILDKGNLYSGMMKNELLQKNIWQQTVHLLDVFSELNEQLDILNTPFLFQRLNNEDSIDAMSKFLTVLQNNITSVGLLIILSIDNGKDLSCVHLSSQSPVLFHISRGGDVFLEEFELGNISSSLKASSSTIELAVLVSKKELIHAGYFNSLLKELRKDELAKMIRYYRAVAKDMATAYKDKKAIEHFQSISHSTSVDASIRGDSDVNASLKSSRSVSNSRNSLALNQITKDSESDQSPSNTNSYNDEVYVPLEPAADSKISKDSNLLELIDSTENKTAEQEFVKLELNTQEGSRKSLTGSELDNTVSLTQAKANLADQIAELPQNNEIGQSVENITALNKRMNQIFSNISDLINDYEIDEAQQKTSFENSEDQSGPEIANNTNIAELGFNEERSDDDNVLQETLHEIDNDFFSAEKLEHSFLPAIEEGTSIHSSPNEKRARPLLEPEMPSVTLLPKDIDTEFQLENSSPIHFQAFSCEIDDLLDRSNSNIEADDACLIRHSEQNNVNGDEIADLPEEIRISQDNVLGLTNQTEDNETLEKKSPDLPIHQEMREHIPSDSDLDHFSGDITNYSILSKQDHIALEPKSDPVQIPETEKDLSAQSSKQSSNDIFKSSLIDEGNKIELELSNNERIVPKYDTFDLMPKRKSASTTQSLISEAKTLIAEADEVLRESVVVEVMESHDEEDLEDYGLRAFKAIRRDAIENSDLAQYAKQFSIDSSSTSSSQSSTSLAHAVSKVLFKSTESLPTESRESFSLSRQQSLTSIQQFNRQSSFPVLEVSSSVKVLANDLQYKSIEPLTDSRSSDCEMNCISKENVDPVRAPIDELNSKLSTEYKNQDSDRVVNNQPNVADKNSQYGEIYYALHELRTQIEAEYNTKQEKKRFLRKAIGSRILSIFQKNVNTRSDYHHDEEEKAPYFAPNAFSVEAPSSSHIVPNIQLKEVPKAPVVLVFETGKEGKANNEGRRRSLSAGRSVTDSTANNTVFPSEIKKDSKSGVNLPQANKRAISAGRSANSNSRPSNVQQIKNALNNVCLAGVHQDSTRQEAMTLLEEAHHQGVLDPNSENRLPVTQFFILLFQSKSLAFRGIYCAAAGCDDFVRVYGRGPKYLPKDIPVESYLKYLSSSRSFTVIPTKSMTGTTDAIGIDPTKVKKLINIG